MSRTRQWTCGSFSCLYMRRDQLPESCGDADTQPLGEIGVAGNMLQGTIAASERVFEFLEEEEEVKDTENSLRRENYQGRVTFQNVRFRRPRTSRRGRNSFSRLPGSFCETRRS